MTDPFQPSAGIRPPANPPSTPRKLWRGANGQMYQSSAHELALTGETRDPFLSEQVKAGATIGLPADLYKRALYAGGTRGAEQAFRQMTDRWRL